MNTIELTNVPCDEGCAQVGDADYQVQSLMECTEFKAQLLRMYPKPESAEADLKIVSYPHEFGRYRELAVSYGNEDGANWAYLLEAGLPPTWDQAAKDALLAQGYRYLESSLGVMC